MSNNITRLRDRRDVAETRMRALLDTWTKEDRAGTEEEESEYSALEQRIQDLDKQIEREERMATLEVSRVAADDGDETRETARVTDVHDRREDKPFANLGEQMIAVFRAVSSHGQTMDPRLIRSRVDAEGRAITGASETVAADGGFLVQKDFAADVMTRVYETGQVLSRVFPVPIGSNSNGTKINAVDETSRADGSRFGGVQAYWVGEGGSLTATKPKFRQMELTLKKLAALFYATDEVLNDADALTAIAGRAFTEELTFKIEDSIFRGNGGPMPLGFLNANCLVSVAKEGSQAADTILFDNITKMWSRCWGRSRLNSVWLINQDVEPQLINLVLPTNVAPAYMPAGGLSGAQFSTLMGRPVIPVEYCDTIGNQGDIVLADFSQYILARKGGVRADSSIHVRFVNDETVFRWIVRVDGQPWWTSALTPFKGTNTLSPFVVLDERA